MVSEDIIISAAALAAIIVISVATLHGWQGWLALRMRELDHERPGIDAGGGSARIEIADLRERVRNLEAIAAGVDL